MKHRDIILKTLAEAAGTSESEVEDVLELMVRSNPDAFYNLDQEVSDEEAEELLSEFRKQKDGIRQWLLDGAGESDAGK